VRIHAISGLDLFLLMLIYTGRYEWRLNKGKLLRYCRRAQIKKFREQVSYIFYEGRLMTIETTVDAHQPLGTLVRNKTGLGIY